MKRFLLLLSLGSIAALAPAQSSKQDVLKRLDAGKATYEDIARKIWDYAEVGFQETKSSALLQERLSQEGFAVQAGVAAIPTAFVASYGSGHPILAILGEYDALPGVSQEAVAEQKARPGIPAGHACGHHLFGAASAQAAVAVKDWLKATGQPGTIRFYGTPAEEGGSGKVYLVRAGLFADVDAVLHWHPADSNGVSISSSLANRSAKFRFHGIASHASGAPERGRSALDGVESMDYMVNLMREHVPSSTRIHYVITCGGEAPNVVPAFAEVYYYVRSPSRETLLGIWSRVEDAARGAALGTGTKVDWEIIGGVHERLPNETLGRLLHANLSAIGGVAYNEEERVFATKMAGTFSGNAPAAGMEARIEPFNANPPAFEGGGSTDVGDVSWVVPTAGFFAATWVPGTSSHTWQAVACGGTTLGLKGMNVAAKTLAATALDLFAQPELLAKAKADFEKRRGPAFKYAPLIGDRAPALNYRE